MMLVQILSCISLLRDLRVVCVYIEHVLTMPFMAPLPIPSPTIVYEVWNVMYICDPDIRRNL